MITRKRKNPCHRTISGRRRRLLAVFWPGASGPSWQNHWSRPLETTNSGVLVAWVVMTGTRRRGPGVVDDEQISVVLPEHPPVLTPQAAAALLRLLRNVHRSRGRETRQADTSTSGCVSDHDKGG